MLRESQKNLKMQELQLAIAMLNNGVDKNKPILEKLFRDISKLELGFELDSVPDKASTDSDWMKAYEEMKAMTVTMKAAEGREAGVVVSGLSHLTK